MSEQGSPQAFLPAPCMPPRERHRHLPRYYNKEILIGRGIHSQRIELGGPLKELTAEAPRLAVYELSAG